MDHLKIFDAEYRFLCLLWEQEPINSTELARLCFENFGWKKSTTYTTIRRLSQRGIVKNENAVVTALVQREQVQKEESEAFLSKNFGGSLPTFITAFLSDKKISKKEADEIISMIREASEHE